jgi:hypothetical protein
MVLREDRGRVGSRQPLFFAPDVSQGLFCVWYIGEIKSITIEPAVPISQIEKITPSRSGVVEV